MLSAATAHDAGRPKGAAPRAPALDVMALRAQFPALHRPMNGRPLIYLDSAATAQKPEAVLAAHQRAYTHSCANIHRGVYALSAEATRLYEGTREKVASYLHLPAAEEVIFTRGTTEGINLVAQTYGRKNLRPGDEIVVSELEHHSNIVPWQMLCASVGARLRVAPITQDGALDVAATVALLGKQTKIVAISHVSNALGTVLPIRQVIDAVRAHAPACVVLVDGAQAVPHMRVDVGALDCDFYAFSAHKLFGPSGVGVLWGKRRLLEAMPPYQGGGDMIAEVTFAKTTYAAVPHRFEAGTPDIAGVIALGATLDFCNGLDWQAIAAHERELLAALRAGLDALPGVRCFGNAAERAGVVSFVMQDVHPHDIGTILDMEGVAIRAGHHCAQPLMRRLGVAATARASLALYNTRQEVDVFLAALRRVQQLFYRA